MKKQIFILNLRGKGSLNDITASDLYLLVNEATPNSNLEDVLLEGNTATSPNELSSIIIDVTDETPKLELQAEIEGTGAVLFRASPTEFIASLEDSISRRQVILSSSDSVQLRISHFPEEGGSTDAYFKLIPNPDADVTFSTPSDEEGERVVATREFLISPYIEIYDPSEQAFTDLETARTWISAFTDQSLFTNEVFSGGRYRFSCPANTDFSGAINFCSVTSTTQNIQFKDDYGLASVFGNGAFKGNVCDNVINGSVTAGDSFFSEATPPNRNMINRVLMCGMELAKNYVGRFDIAFFGTDETANLPADIFTASGLVWVRTAYSNQFNNEGALDGDIINILLNLATEPNSTVLYE